MFVTAQFAQAVDTSAFLVPQQAVTRDPQGNATLFVVGPGNRAVQRTVVADRTQGPYWVVTQGLAPGEKVITQGTAQPEGRSADQAGAGERAAEGQGAAAGRNEGDAERSAAASACRGFSSNGRSSPGSLRSSSCSAGSARSSRFRSRNIPTSRRPRSTSARAIPARRRKRSKRSVTQVIEENLTGLDGLLYFSSSSSSRGSVSISAVFDKGVDPDIAQVQVQNKVQSAVARLPQQVQQQGVTVTKGSPDFLMIVGVYDATDKTTNVDVSDWLADQHPGRSVARSPASATSTSSARKYAMRIWLDPNKLQSFQLMPSDVITAIQNQNVEVAAGEIGGMPQPAGADARCDRHRPVAAPDARAVPQHHRQGRPVGRARAAVGRRPGRARRGQLFGDRSGSTAIPGAGIGIYLEPGANALVDLEARQGRDGAASSRACRPATMSPTPTTAPTSSGCRSSRW